MLKSLELVAVEGAAVKEHQVIAVLETEKSSYDLESKFEDILHIVKQALNEKIKAGCIYQIEATIGWLNNLE